MLSNDDKAFENRLRRSAKNRGYLLERNPARTPSAYGYGLYRLRAPTGTKVLAFTIPLDAVPGAIANAKAPTSKGHRWLTPRYLVDPLGEFDLDPAGAPGHTLARTTYIPENGHDGLSLPWHGRVWLNPPYGAKGAPFVALMAEHGCGTALLDARTDSRAWERHVWPVATALLFIHRPVRFLGADGSPAKLPAFYPSAMVAYGNQDADRLEASGISGAFIDLRRTRI